MRDGNDCSGVWLKARDDVLLRDGYDISGVWLGAEGIFPPVDCGGREHDHCGGGGSGYLPFGATCPLITSAVGSVGMFVDLKLFSCGYPPCPLFGPECSLM